ncbi:MULTISPECIES: hypothetical protein [Acinetobacter]|uniref:Uncharacterized protein n=1 Tax=Acinetobacter higginsii TaxID=70347 RepID=N9SP63_9GAMM|nr:MULTISPECIES: hypothetical protein [Acinetobacter]ENX53062.1 hypothetical protein F902_03925 [Acinetobacter higginsii]MCH7303364.1 hypothetical protein [Acinetobacter higginsii]
MMKPSYLGWGLLNLQLTIGFAYSYDYFHRHIIVDHVLAFTLLVIFIANLFFFFTKFIKNYSLRAFISIIFSSVLVSILFIQLNREDANFIVSDVLLLFGYMMLRMLLYITTPIALVVEFFLKKNN